MPKKHVPKKSLNFAVIGSSSNREKRDHLSTNLFDKLLVNLLNVRLGTLRSGKWVPGLRILSKERTEWLQIEKD